MIIYRKFKLNKKFIPVICDTEDELFPNGIFEFNITKLLKYIHANRHNFQPEAIKIQSLSIFNSRRLNESVVCHADLANPIILAEISPNTFNVIDGHHRLEKARRQNINEILAYKVCAEQHINFLTSVRAYESYVHYWNEKLKRN